MRLVLSCSRMKRFVEGVTVPPCLARRALTEVRAAWHNRWVAALTQISTSAVRGRYFCEAVWGVRGNKKPGVGPIFE